MLGPEDKEPKMIGEKHTVITNHNASFPLDGDILLRLQRLLKSDKFDADKVGIVL